MDRYNLGIRSVALNKLKAEDIEHLGLVSIEMKSEGITPIEIDNSWVGLCELLLGTIHYNNTSNFLNMLFKGGVMTSEFQVSTVGLVTLDKNDKTKVIDIGNTGFKIVTSLNSKSLIVAIKAMLKILDIDSKSVKLNMIEVDELSSIHKIRNGETSIETYKVNLSNGVKQLSNNAIIKALIIEGKTNNKVSSLLGATIEIVKYMKIKNEAVTLTRIQTLNMDTIGIVGTKELDNFETKQVGRTGIYVYSSSITTNSDYIVYMTSICNEFGIPTTSIELVINQLVFIEVN